MKVFKGIPVVSGIAIGQAIISTEKQRVIHRFITPDAVEQEINRLRNGIKSAVGQLEKIRNKSERLPYKDVRLILNTHLLLTKDKKLSRLAESLIKKELINSEWALEIAIRDIKKTFEKVTDSYLKERATDIDAVADRIVGNISGKYHKGSIIDTPAIIIAHNLSPAQLAQFRKDIILGIGLDIGTKTSHTSIVAKALGIPTVVGLENISIYAKTGDLVILDGNNGSAIVRPTKELISKYRVNLERQNAEEKNIMLIHSTSPVTEDGIKVTIKANVELPEEVMLARENGAEGIGIYRTEFLIQKGRRIPGEVEQFELYKRIAEYMHPFPVNIRSMDIGMEKLYDSTSLLAERNPAMGLRGIRLAFKERRLFKTQIKAILRSSVMENVRIMFPLITDISELRKVKNIVDEVKEELLKSNVQFNENIKIGIMLETPSACLTSDILANEIDFISIGTNDLIQYTLAIDRFNENVAYLYNPLKPSVLRLLKMAIDNANGNGVEIEMCGEMAGEPASHFL